MVIFFRANDDSIPTEKELDFTCVAVEEDNKVLFVWASDG